MDRLARASKILLLLAVTDRRGRLGLAESVGVFIMKMVVGVVVGVVLAILIFVVKDCGK